MAEEKKVGKITHYFSKIGVGVVKLTDSLKTGQIVHVKGATTDFEQAISSMQIEHQSVETAKAGDDIGVEFDEKVREGDEIFVIEE